VGTDRAVRPRADLAAAAVAAGLVLAAVLAGWWWSRGGHPVGAAAAPLHGQWRPRVGPGTPIALAVAVLVVGYGPRLARRLRWRPLLGLGYLAAVAWSAGLGLVDGWRVGLADRLITEHEYLAEVRGVTDVPVMLRMFTGRILDLQPDSWATYVAGHPPGALLVFVGLDRLGLHGGGWAAAVCVLAGATTVATVPLTLRALGAERAGRASVPFLVLFPGAVWFGASADAIFAAVTTAGVALLAIGVARGRHGWAFGGGALLGLGAFLSYGLVLMLPLALAVALVARRPRPLLAAAGGAAVVAVAFAALGFWWLDGYRLAVRRYQQGAAAERPYAYWVWANLAVLVLSAGLAVAPILRRVVLRAVGTVRTAWTGRASRVGRAVRAARSMRVPRAVRAMSGWRAVRRPLGRVPPALALPLAAVLAIVVADLTGLGDGEVERTWLPFAVWLPAAAVLLPPGSRWRWLAVQAATALVVNHLIFTTW
jgi:hypothetical protein